jgi:nitroreductase
MTDTQAARLAPATSFDQALQEALGIAALSPSSHNCQPWALARLTSAPARAAAAAVLSVAEDDDHTYLALALDRERELRALPAHAVEMWVSCGLYWGFLSWALEALGWDAVSATVLDQRGATEARAVPGWPSPWSPLAVAAFARSDRPADPGAAARLRAVALARRTNRGPYRELPLDPVLLHRLANRPDRAITVTHLCTTDERASFADAVAQHGARDFAHSDAWRETYSYLRWSDAEADGHGDGFTLGQLFGPVSAIRRGLMRAAFTPAVMRDLRYVGYHRALAQRLAQVVRQTPAAVAIGVENARPDQAGLVQAGAALADYWLDVTRAGLALHPISVVLQHEDVRRQLQAALSLPGRTILIARLGYPATEFPRSPRRAAAAPLREF